MKKRILCIILIATLVLPTLISVGYWLLAPKSQFEAFDAAREENISASLGNTVKANSKSESLSAENRYVIKFNENVSLGDIETVLSNTSYNLLAESDSRIFAVELSDKSFLEKYADIIDYAEPDLIRNTLAVVNDPAKAFDYETLGIYDAWDTVQASSDIIVAVLDTGIDRNHEDLIDANILAGYDAVSGKAGVSEDSAGHGTGVAGLIAATANNSLGIAGIAHGVTILPVKVSTTGTTIYSSDLIRGIRFAADAGAKIINMSIGGYSSSFAEQEAINYAVSKGCIVIAAAGNGGELSYAEKKSYPASYDGVISVASCNADGERSSFSQYNDAVDVAAPGESVVMPYMNEEGSSVYRSDSGTSYSCAFVSGIAALAASYIGDSARFGSDEFLALIIDTCGSTRTNSLGYGVINVSAMLEKSALPIITGVYNGGKYSDSVTVGFNRGTATLDGEVFEDGETIVINGNHTVTVTDGENTKTVNFRVDYDPLSYEFEEFAAFSYFEFTRGAATLDGFPYVSGQHITSSGRHEFVLVYGEERVTEEINLQYTLPTVYGIEDGGSYNVPIEIRIIGDGYAQLDGVAVYGETVVAENGSHTLSVKSGNGALSKEYNFEINIPYITYGENDFPNASAAIDEENGYICLYGEAFGGIKIYDIASPGTVLKSAELGRIHDHAFSENNLLLFGQNGITVLERSTVITTEELTYSTVSIEGIDCYTYGDGNIYCFGNGNVYTLDLATGATTLIAETGIYCETAFYTNGVLCMLAPSFDSIVHILNCATSEYYSYDLGKSIDGVSICAGEGYLAAGTSLYNAASGEKVLDFKSFGAVKIENGMLFCENRIIDIASGEELGSFPFDISDMVFGSDKVYLFGVYPIFATVSAGAEGVNALGAAKRLDKVFSESETINEFRKNAFSDGYAEIISVASSETSAYVLFSDRNALYGFDIESFTEMSAVRLRYEPSKVIYTNGYIAVCFGSANSLYFASETDLNNGIYISLPDICDSAAILGDTLYIASGGMLITCLTDGNDMFGTTVSAESVITDGTHIFTVFEKTLYKYDNLFTLLASTAVSDGTPILSNGIAIGKNIYDLNTLEMIASADSAILACKGNVAVTKKGVFDILAKEYIGKAGIGSPESAVIGGGNSIVAFADCNISVCSFGDGKEVVSSPVISGVSDGGIYLDHITVNYDCGIGYLDGVAFASGDTATGTGEHELIIALPCGRSVSLKFIIEAQVSEIGFLVGDRTISVGETVTLRIKYMPDGASSVPVRFSCDSEGLLLDQSGEATALSVGTYTVTAEAATPHGTFTATCVITVRDDLIAVSPDSGLTVDRDYGILHGVSAGTNASDLLSMLTAGKDAIIVDNKGNSVSGYVGTGDRIILNGSNGIVADELNIAVTGDADGDGYISAYDLYVLERILRGYEFDNVFKASADINGNGVLAHNDYRALKYIILGRTESPLGNTTVSPIGKVELQTVTNAKTGDIIDVPVILHGLNYARGIFGTIQFEGLEFIGAVSTGWELDHHSADDKISFYVYDEDGKVCNTSFKTLVNLQFRVTAQAGETISLTVNNMTVSFTDGCREVNGNGVQLSVSETEYGEFKINFGNAYSFEFDPNVFDYIDTVPYNSAIADISIVHQSNENVSISSLIVPDSGSNTITIAFTNNNGATLFYNISVMRENSPRVDTNSKLDDLKVDGFEISPKFDPEHYEYSITVPYGTEKVEVLCSAQSVNAQIIVSDTGLLGTENDITVTVIAQNGEASVYTLNVSMLPEPIVSDDPSNTDDSSLPDDSSDNKASEPSYGSDSSTAMGGGQSANWTMMIVIAAAIAMVAAIMFYVRSGSASSNKNSGSDK